MTPEDVLSHPARVLTERQREYYFEHGYVTVEGAISRGWLDRLHAVTSEMVEKARSITQSNDVFILEDGHTCRVRRARSTATGSDPRGARSS